uniref:Uncharacterized protein n=1 Tax=Arundo donax TaxID=35708 RepID=A0A0A8Z7F9_ARUDO
MFNLAASSSALKPSDTNTSWSSMNISTSSIKAGSTLSPSESLLPSSSDALLASRDITGFSMAVSPFYTPL